MPFRHFFVQRVLYCLNCNLHMPVITYHILSSLSALPCTVVTSLQTQGEKSAQTSCCLIGQHPVSRHQKIDIIGWLSVPGNGQLLHSAAVFFKYSNWKNKSGWAHLKCKIISYSKVKIVLLLSWGCACLMKLTWVAVFCLEPFFIQSGTNLDYDDLQRAYLQMTYITVTHSVSEAMVTSFQLRENVELN